MKECVSQLKTLKFLPMSFQSEKYASLFCIKTTMKLISCQNQKHEYLIYTWSDKAFYGYPCESDGSLKITL